MWESEHVAVLPLHLLPAIYVTIVPSRAKLCSLTIPQAVLLRADELIK
jgi:hypothetical protein